MIGPNCWRKKGTRSKRPIVARAGSLGQYRRADRVGASGRARWFFAGGLGAWGNAAGGSSGAGGEKRAGVPGRRRGDGRRTSGGDDPGRRLRVGLAWGAAREKPRERALAGGGPMGHPGVNAGAGTASRECPVNRAGSLGGRAEGNCWTGSLSPAGAVLPRVGGTRPVSYRGWERRGVRGGKTSGFGGTEVGIVWEWRTPGGHVAPR
jgi:hypothetical protein